MQQMMKMTLQVTLVSMFSNRLGFNSFVTDYEDAEQFLAVNHEHDDEALARSAQEEEAMHIAEVAAEDGGNELSPDVPAEEDHHKVEAAL